MSYRVKEILYTLQGEGVNVGRPSVFVRFSDCNLWSGLEEDRATAACRFCDTDFVGTDGPGGGTFLSAEELAGAAMRAWTGDDDLDDLPLVVCTGGEPLRQLDARLVSAFQGRGFEVAIETNGTLLPPEGVDWICVSPKAGTKLRLTEGDELKLVFPQEGAEPERYEDLAFTHHLLQPLDESESGPEKETNTLLALRYCLAHPRWRLSLQTHKILDIP